MLGDKEVLFTLFEMEKSEARQTDRHSAQVNVWVERSEGRPGSWYRPEISAIKLC